MFSETLSSIPSQIHEFNIEKEIWRGRCSYSLGPTMSFYLYPFNMWLPVWPDGQMICSNLAICNCLICPNHWIFAKVDLNKLPKLSKCSSYIDNYSKISPKWRNFAKSDHTDGYPPSLHPLQHIALEISVPSLYVSKQGCQCSPFGRAGYNHTNK